MKPRSLLSVAASSVLLLLSASAVRPINALSLFGFGSSSDSTAEAKARAAVVALIKENAAADVFVPPALGVGRQDAARFEAARAAGKLVCSAGGGDTARSAEIAWDRVNDDFCDCPYDGSDEPGTSACSNGDFFFVLLFLLLAAMRALFRLSSARWLSHRRISRLRRMSHQMLCG